DPDFNLPNSFIKDFYNSKKILLKSMITEVAQLAIECNNHQEIVVWLKQFIDRQKEMKASSTKK
ncbi:19955_t:CDS:2, partial [Racocetra fulgida]